MSVRRLAETQPESFAFTEANTEWANRQIAKYPPGRQASAVISLLWRAQEQEGWVTEPAIRAVAAMLDMPRIRVLEIATFYTMFRLEPMGKVAHIQVCGTTPCWLRGADGLKEVCRKRIHHDQFHVSADGAFSWEEVECIGACVNAPLIQIEADTYEDLTPERFEQILDDLAAGKSVKPGPQIDRQYSAPVGGPTTLTGIGSGARTTPTDPGPSPGQAEAGDQAPIAAARPRAAAESPADPTGAISQKAEKAADSESTEEKREEIIHEATGDPEPLAATTVEANTAGARSDIEDFGKPKPLAEPREGKPDDLKRISGIGPKIEETLNGLGVYHFDQIAAWSEGEVAWVEKHLDFQGRIERDDWIGQARKLVPADDEGK